MTNFRALLTEIHPDGTAQTHVRQLDITMLPDNPVLIRVAYSSLNYKDALSASGHKGITRNFPHIPGIDAAGIVENDSSGQFSKGARVIVTGFDLGMNTYGGLSEYIRVPAEWVVEIPDQLTFLAAMHWGTAGLTAAMAVDALIQNQISPDRGEILVTGASGGVGVMSIQLLKKLGYSVVALSGKPELSNGLMELGASQVRDRQAFLEVSSKALFPMEFAGAIDTLGGDFLVQVVKKLKFGGSVAVCGMAAGVELPMQVYPFILRGIRMLGIYSADSALTYKKALWAKIANEWALENPLFGQVISLEEVPAILERMLVGTSHGRYIVKI